MAFTVNNIAAMEAALKQGAGALLSLQTVYLYQAGTVSVKLHVGQRRTSSVEVTGGATEQNQYATIDADDWDNKVGRIPQRGDQIEWAGRKYAIDNIQVIAPAGNRSFYKARLTG